MIKICPGCSKENRDKAKFCSFCATSLEQKINICPQCHRGNRDKAKFCSFCATSLLKKTKTCPQCNKENRDKAKFCSFCSASFLEEVTCLSCKTKNDSTARFCTHCAAPLKDIPLFHPGTGLLISDSMIAGRYRVIQKIGHGGMAAIYMGMDTRLDSIVAIKEMSDNTIMGDEDKQKVREAFEREAKILARLEHINIPRVTDHFTDEGKQYLVMDFIDGCNLEEKLEQASGHLEEEEVKNWAIQLCNVLDYLHNQSPPIIFRDLKPENILLNRKGTLKLIDFGIARLFNPERPADTLSFTTAGYSPPEQFGRQTDARSDIYSLGVTLHHLLTGFDPLQAIFNLPPANSINPLVSEEMSRIITRATQMRLDARWQTARELREAFETMKIPSGDIPLRSEITVPLLIVSQRETGHYKTLTEAMEAAKTGSRILVRAGIYREDIKVKKKLYIEGDGICDEIIIKSNRAVLIEAEDVRVSGITICRDEDVESKGTTQPDFLSSFAISISALSSLIEGCKIYDSRGYGIIVNNESKAVIKDCEINKSKLPAIYIVRNSNPVIKRCRLYHCSGSGIVFNDGSGGTVEDCDISFSMGSGIKIKEKSNPTIRQCKIQNGRNNGILITKKGAGLIEDCYVSGNFGSGVTITEGGNSIIRNSRICNGESAGIYVYDGGFCTVENCEIFANAMPGIAIRDGGNSTLRNCRIYEGKDCGILITEKGQGSVEDCIISGNAGKNLIIKNKEFTNIQRCKVEQ